MFSRLGAAAIRKDLINTVQLCEALGHPEQQFKSVHIAGTNGKGSTSHMLASVLQSAGYKTGLYTSPHLKDFRERIRINGEMISEENVTRFTERIKPYIESLEPSFFEITVAMAFDHFANERVDIAVIEVGLGGRLDSTNVIKPELAVITNIGYDHMNLLGDTLDKIAAEKAGIIKDNIPVVIGESIPETRPVFEDVAASKHAPLFFAQQHWEIHEAGSSSGRLHCKAYHLPNREEHTYSLDLPGIYQLKNLATILESIEQLRNSGWNISEEAVRNGLSNVKLLTGLHGRWEQIAEHPAIILDVAHNEPGMMELVRQLQKESFNALHIVVGMVKDKEIDKVLQLLPEKATYYFTKAPIPRALPELELQQKAISAGLKGEAFPTVSEALEAARKRASHNDLILVCGSVFIVAEVTLN